MLFCSNDFDWVLPNLAIGNLDAGTDLKKLKKLGVKGIVSAVTQLPQHLKEYRKNGISILHIPIKDREDTDIRVYFNAVNEFIKRIFRQSGKVLVHCRAGMSRSVTLTAAYLIKTQNITPQDALAKIGRVRVCYNPNDGFVRQLHQYRACLVRKQCK